MTDVAIVILAGGRATRFPGKLEAQIEGMPLLARVYANLRDSGPVVIAAAATFSPELDAKLDCPIVVDRWPQRGPLGGLLSACGEIGARRMFVVAGDAPRVNRNVLESLIERYADGDEAVIPIHDGRREPLAALYDRTAVLREGFDVLHEGNASMHALLDRLRVREVPLSADYFSNINTAADLVQGATTR
jgi:molybdopterin-guanine dinucleotide biosynthesis protein A